MGVGHTTPTASEPIFEGVCVHWSAAESLTAAVWLSAFLFFYFVQSET